MELTRGVTWISERCVVIIVNSVIPLRSVSVAELQFRRLYCTHGKVGG